jgi:GTP:adenosylcobinamide-phosphate guanylyltransferase
LDGDTLVSALVLAGGRPDELSARQPGIANKAFLHVAGVALVERTLRGLRESQRVGRIVVVAPPGTHGDPALALADECRADGARITDSLAAGLAGLPPDETILVAAADLPVLRAAAVDDFVARALERSLDVGYGCVERRAHVAQYAHVRHTWARLRDGTYCGAGLVVLRPRVFAALERFMESLGRSRKNPLALASLFGWDMLLLFAAGALSIAKAETRASSLLGAPAGALVSPYPEIAVNVDRPADVAVAERLVAGL